LLEKRYTFGDREVPMIILAHDGSLYGDWVARYAMRFAATDSDRKLLLLHVCDGHVDPVVAEARFARLAEECAGNAVVCQREMLPLGKSVHRTLRQAIPHDPEALLVCGTRVKPRRQAFLAGTVAEQLLRMHQCPVLALRVVQPGLLGLPHHLLLPLAGHQTGLARLWPIFRRLIPQLRRVHFFYAVPVNPLTEPLHSIPRRLELRQIGERYLDRIYAELFERIDEPPFTLDRRALTTSDWSRQVLIEASRLKVQILLLGASERSLAHRVFHGQALERILRDAPCDVGIYRGP
jgi:nucleotide-binding universal stress UspA family protein